MRTFTSIVRGVTFTDEESGQDRQAFIRSLPDEPFVLQPKLEPDNPYDPNAIGLWVTRETSDGSPTCRVGYISRELAAKLAPLMRAGQELHVTGVKNPFLVGLRPIVAIDITIFVLQRRRTGRPSR